MNRCRTKFTCLIGYKQFRYHNYLESCKKYCEKAKFVGKLRSPGDFTSAFEVSCDFKREGRVHREVVAAMLHRRRKNATPVLGIGKSTSIVLNGLSIGVG